MSNKAINWVMSLDRPRGYKSVLVAVANSANEYMAAWPKRKTIGERVGLKPDTVRDYLNQAVKDGDLIIVPWQAHDGGDAAPGYFLGCVRSMFPELPPLEMAFAKRINFRGLGKGGQPREYTPAWWSGEKLGGGHRCTCCGQICRGGEANDEQTASTLRASALIEPAPEVNADFEAPAERNSTRGTRPERERNIDPFDPGEGGLWPTGEGLPQSTGAGRLDPTPLINTSEPPLVVPQPRANAEAFARSSSLDSQAELSPGGGSGGRVETDARSQSFVPAASRQGDGLRPRGSAAPGHMISNQASESIPPLRLSPREKRQREREAIRSAIAAVESTLSPTEAQAVLDAALTALQRADVNAHEAARTEALAAIAEPAWGPAGTSARYEREVAAYTLRVALGARPLSRWPKAVLTPLGLADGRAAAA